MSLHICTCQHNAQCEYHLRYPGASETEMQALADLINAGALDQPNSSARLFEQHQEDRIEQAYWNFDARRNGLSIWRRSTMSERDAFKTEMRTALQAEGIIASARLIAAGWRKS